MLPPALLKYSDALRDNSSYKFFVEPCLLEIVTFTDSMNSCHDAGRQNLITQKIVNFTVFTYEATFPISSQKLTLRIVPQMRLQ